MDDALILVRIGLAAVFVVAGLAKLLDRSGSTGALVEFGVPDRLARPLGILLPVGELATAIMLVFATTARWGGVAALALLAAFILGLARALRRGEAPDCHCFGQVHSEPASWTTVARNVALAVPAAYLVAAGPGPSLPAWTDGQSPQDLWLIATSTLAALSSATSLVLWRQNRRLRVPHAPTLPTPLRIGTRAPRFSLPSVNGQMVSLEDLLVADRPCLLTFVAPGCGPCATLLPQLARWHDSLGDRLTIPVVSTGDAASAEAIEREHGVPRVLADEEAAVSKAYAVPGFPCALLVAADGTVSSAPAPGQGAIEALIRRALQAEPDPGLVVHQVA